MWMRNHHAGLGGAARGASREGHKEQAPRGWAQDPSAPTYGEVPANDLGQGPAVAWATTRPNGSSHTEGTRRMRVSANRGADGGARCDRRHRAAAPVAYLNCGSWVRAQDSAVAARRPQACSGSSARRGAGAPRHGGRSGPQPHGRAGSISRQRRPRTRDDHPARCWRWRCGRGGVVEATGQEVSNDRGDAESHS